MKHIYRLIVCVFCLFSIQQVNGQDPHYSQFYSAPLMLNPAMTGSFNGSYRVVANYRNQWSSITSNPYRTFAGSFDLRLDVGKQSRDGIGLGVSAYNDVAGDSDFGTTRGSVAVAYLKSLNDRSNHYLSVGFEGSVEYRTINYSALYFDNQFTGDGFDPLAPSGESFENDSYLNYDINTGIMWYYVPSDRFQVFASYTMHHLLRPNQSFDAIGLDGLYLRYSFATGIGVGLSDNIELISSMLFMKQGPHLEANFGAGLKYFTDKRRADSPAISGGAWLRSGRSESSSFATDALIVVATYYWKTIQIGLSYDVNISTLSRASGGRGGFEVSIIHIGNFSRVPKPKTIDCPKF